MPIRLLAALAAALVVATVAVAQPATPQQLPPGGVAPTQPTIPAQPGAPESTPQAVMPVAPGSPPASVAADLSATRPESMPILEKRPAATQVVPGPEATGGAPVAPR